MGQLRGSGLPLTFFILLGTVGYPALIFSLLEGEGGRNSRVVETSISLMAQAKNWHIVISAYTLLAKESQMAKLKAKAQEVYPTPHEATAGYDEELRANIQLTTPTSALQELLLECRGRTMHQA